MIPPAVSTPAPIVSPAGEKAGAGISERSVLRDRIDLIVANAKKTTGGTLGVVVWDLGTNVLVQNNAEQPFPMASTFKLAVAYAAYASVDRGIMRLDSRVAVERGDLVRGVSPIAEAYDRTTHVYSVRDLLSRMLVDSDNTAADVLYRVVGGADAINAALHNAGFDAIVIRTNEAGNAANERAGKTFASGADNAGSPAAIALFLSALVNGRILSASSRSAFLDELARVKTGPDRLRAGLPANVRLRHKTGTSATIGGVVDATNDVGIATVNGRDVVIVAMLEGAAGTAAQRDAILADVARAATDATRAFPL